MKRKTPFQREWETLCQKERCLLERRRRKEESALNRLLAEKVPEKLQGTLDAAFEKAFSLIFKKGTRLIEKTYRKEELENRFKLRRYADKLEGSRKSLRAFAKDADRAGNVNLAISGAAGVGMGLFGIGLPDIPVFTCMILKCIYEIALSYGFDYTARPERYWILLLIEGAVSYGDRLDRVNERVDAFLANPCLPEGYLVSERISETSAALSRELLYMKFLQGLPVIGAVGGAYDVVYMRRIAEYAGLKYRKRFLIQRLLPSEREDL